MPLISHYGGGFGVRAGGFTEEKPDDCADRDHIGRL